MSQLATGHSLDMGHSDSFFFLNLCFYLFVLVTNQHGKNGNEGKTEANCRIE